MSQSYMLTISIGLVDQADPSFVQYFARHISNNHDIQTLVEDLKRAGIATGYKDFDMPPAASPAVNAPDYYRPVYIYYLWNACDYQWMIWSTCENRWTCI
jgi:hypothetical protein